MRMKVNPTTGRLDLVGSSDATQITYSNAQPTIERHGGIEPGTTFENVPIATVLDQILHPYVPPAIVLTAKPGGQTFELGTKATIKLSATVTAGSCAVKKVELLQDGQPISTDDATITAGGKISLAFGSVSISKAATFSARVTDTTDKEVKSNAIAYAFRLPIYWALIGGKTVTEADTLHPIIPQSASGNVSLPFPAFDNKRMAVMTSGTITAIANPAKLAILNSFEQTTTEIVGADGVRRTFNAYISNPNSQQKAYPCTATYSGAK